MKRILTTIVLLAISGGLILDASAGDLITEHGKLKLLDKVDCTKDVSAGKYMEKDPATVVQSPIGAYRTTTEKLHSWFAYRFDVENPNKPHILSVTYPDDAERANSFEVHDAAERHPKGAGVITGRYFRVTNTMRKQDVVFWPNKKKCVFTVTNWHRGSAAAAASFEVYEVLDGLPAVVMNLPEGLPQRQIGLYVEDASADGYWGGVNPSLEQWDVTLENLSSYLSYVGQNVYSYPITWYDGPIFPCPTTEKAGRNSGAYNNNPAGMFDIMLDKFEQRGIGLYGILYLRDTYALHNISDDPAADGIYQIWRDGKRRTHWVGKRSPSGYNLGPLYNPLHPKVQEVFFGIVDDFLANYGDKPGLSGISISQGLGWGGCPSAESLAFERLDSDYSDFTINLFEKETGIRVPGTADDPNRFEKRYQFLTGEKRSEWIKWRCEKIHEVTMKICERVWNTRPDLKVIISFSGSPVNARNRTGVVPWLGDIDWNEALLECGLDLELYKGNPRLLIEYHALLGDHSWAHTGIPDPHRDRLMRSIPEFNAPFFNGANTARSFHHNYWEALWIYDELKEGWPDAFGNSPGGPVRVITPAGNNILEPWAESLGQSEMTVMFQGGMGTSPMQGHKVEASYFAKAFRALPAVAFDDVDGLSDPVRVRQYTHDKETYFYLVNRAPFEVKVDLGLSRKAVVTDLVSGDTNRAFSGYEVALEPYMLRSFKMNKSRITGGKTRIPADEIKTLESKLAQTSKEYSELLELIKKIDEPTGLALNAPELSTWLERGQNALSAQHPVEAAMCVSFVEYGMKRLTAEPQVRQAMNKGAIVSLEWLIAGRIDDDGGKAFKREYEIEKDLVGKRAIKDEYSDAKGLKYFVAKSGKKPHAEYVGEGFIDVADLFEKYDNTLIYAVTDLVSTKKQKVKIGLGWDDWVVLWINGKEIFFDDAPSLGAFPMQQPLEVTLEKGVNQVVLKLDNTGGPGGFYFYLYDENGVWPSSVKNRAPEIVLPKTETVKVEKIEYNGWKDAVQLSNESAEMVIVPSIGRVMKFALIGGENPLWEEPTLFGKKAADLRKDNPNAWANFGGDKVWPVEQRDYPQLMGTGWPPEKAFDGGECTVEMIENGIRMTTPVSVDVEAQGIREFVLDEKLPLVRIRQEIVKTGDKPALHLIQNVTQVRPEYTALLAVGPDSYFGEGGVSPMTFPKDKLKDHLKRYGDFISIPAPTDWAGKVNTDSRRGWVCAIDEKQAFFQFFQYQPGVYYPESGCTLEVYLSPQYFELEILSQARMLRKGEKLTNEIAWALAPFPKNANSLEKKTQAAESLAEELTPWNIIKTTK